jgi:hypothetical protein
MTDQNTNAWIEAQFVDGAADGKASEPPTAPPPAEPARHAPAPAGARPPQAPPRPPASVRQSIADLMRGGRPPAPPTAPQRPAEPVTDTAPEGSAVAAPCEEPEIPEIEATSPAVEPDPVPAEALLSETSAAPPAPPAPPTAVASGSAPRTDDGLPDLDRYFPWLRDRKPVEPPAASAEPEDEPQVIAAPSPVDLPAADEVVHVQVTAAPEPERPEAPESEPAGVPEPPQAAPAPRVTPLPSAKQVPTQPSRAQPRRRAAAPPLTAEEFWALRPQPIDRFVAMGNPRPAEAAQACRDRLDQIGRMLGGGAVSPSERAALDPGPGPRKGGCTIQPTDGGEVGTLRAALEFIGTGGRRPQD